jgi:hypothetical protein
MGDVYSMGEIMVAGNLLGLWQNIASLAAWVTQMFTGHQIGYTVVTAFVTINVEI